MEAGDIVDSGEGAVVAGRSLGSGRMTSKPEVDFPIADHCEVEVQGFI